jgi:hypothetical protein
MPTPETCPDCGAVIEIGDWPFCPHGKANPAKGFEPYFDIGLGREVTGWGDVRQSMREQHLDFRDHPNKEQTEKYFERARLSQEGRR